MPRLCFIFTALVPIFWAQSVAFAQAQASFSIFANASDITPQPNSQDCANALASSIQCSSDLIAALPSSTVAIANLTETSLTALCNNACFHSLTTVIANVDNACAGWPYIVGTTSYMASLPFRFLAYNFNRTCTKGSTANSTTSDFCLLSDQQSSSDADVNILTLPATQLCTGCILNPLNIQMSSPFGWDSTFVGNWSSIQQTCKVSLGGSVAPPSLVLNASSISANATSINITASPTLTPASASNCVFASYTVKTGDSCKSIASSQGVSFDQLIAINGFDMNCTVLPAVGQKICLPGGCSLYTVQTNDTCVSISGAHSVTWAQLLSWNPQLNTYCSNINTQVGKGICVGPPGGGYTAASTILPVTLGTATALAVPTAPVAPGADRADCGLWYTAVLGDTCPQILSIFQLTNETFYLLNPLINSDCSNLLAGFAYCVEVFGNLTTTTATPTPTATGATLLQVFSGEFPQGTGFATGGAQNMTVTPTTAVFSTSAPPPTATATPTLAPGTIQTGCFDYYEIQPGDTCLAITVQSGITQAELMAWNTGINSACSNLTPGLSLCVYSTPIFTTPTFVPPPSTSASSSSSSTSSTTSSPAASPTAPGTILTGCTEYYTVVSGDFCGKIEDMFDITFAQFQIWNPEVDAACDNIQAGLQYCVSGPTGTTTSTPAASPTAPGTITTGCTKYYTVVSGDFCGKIETMFGITFAQFVAWNPEVDTACDNIQVGLEYCVAGPTVTTSSTPPAASPTASGTITTGCTEYYTVVSGDFCAKIESMFSITFAQFQAWNPEIDTACDNLQLGLQYCVSGPAAKKRRAGGHHLRRH